MDKGIILVMQRGLPNFLSASRILLAPIVASLYSSANKMHFLLTLGIVTIALVTDFADGYLARKFKVASEAGYILDGLGDRAMYIALTLAFLKEHEISQVLLWLLIYREILVYAMRVLECNWYQNKSRTKIFSRLQGGAIRCWFLVYFSVDGLRLYDLNIGQHGNVFLELLKGLLLGAAIILGYYHVYLDSKLNLTGRY